MTNVKPKDGSTLRMRHVSLGSVSSQERSYTDLGSSQESSYLGLDLESIVQKSRYRKVNHLK